MKNHILSTVNIIFIFFLVTFLFSNSYSQAIKDKTSPKYIKKTLTIDSVPQGAEIFIDNKYFGKTPLLFENTLKKNMKITAKLNGKVLNRIIGPINNSQEVFFVMDGNYGMINITTIPDSAEVFVKDSLIGFTPLIDKKFPLGLMNVKIKKKDYLDINRSFFVNPSKYNMKFDMTYKFGFITYTGNNKIFVDDNPLIKSNSFRLPVGLHKIKILSKNFYKPVFEDVLIKSDVHYSLNFRYNYFTPNYILYSLIIPGLGQYSDKSEIKGIAFFLGAVAGAILYSSSSSDYNSSLDEFNINKNLYVKADNESDALKLRQVLEASTVKLDDAKKKKNLMLGVLIGVYSLNILDAILFHTTGSSIQLTKNLDLNYKGNNIELKYAIH